MSWNSFLIKVFAEKKVCESREQRTGPTQNARDLHKTPNANENVDAGVSKRSLNLIYMRKKNVLFLLL